MKRKILIPALAACLLAASAAAERARYLSRDGDAGYHSRHLLMHEGDESCRASGNYLKVRQRASGGASVAGHAEQADLLQLLEVDGNWAKIRVLYSADTSPDSWPGLTGWVDASYLECGCSERAYYGGYTDGKEGGEILSGGVNLRELPSPGARSLGKCQRGERVLVLGRYPSGGRTYYRVVRRNGQNGFVSSDYLDVGGNPPRMSYSSGNARPSYGGDERGSGDVRATTYQLRVRATPGGEVLGHISSLDTLSLLERRTGWARIRVVSARSGYDDCWTGLTGWVSTEYLRFADDGDDGGDGEDEAPSDSFSGSYRGTGSDEGSALRISGGSCTLDIYRLASITAYGSDRGGWLDLYGTDPAGNPIRFAVTRLNAREVMVTVTQTTWTYLSSGDVFRFIRN